VTPQEGAVFYFFFVEMEIREYAEIYFRLTCGFRPERFKGKAQKDNYGGWRRRVDKTYTVLAKEVDRDLSFLNCVLVKKTKLGPKVLVRKDLLALIWEKFHLSNTSGGHQGMSA
jgi:hypothetical protein